MAFHPFHATLGINTVLKENGTKNVLIAAARYGVKRIMNCSSITAYGFHPDNPAVLTEASLLRGNDNNKAFHEISGCFYDTESFLFFCNCNFESSTIPVNSRTRKSCYLFRHYRYITCYGFWTKHRNLISHY
jgi:hypothetical protein